MKSLLTLSIVLSFFLFFHSFDAVSSLSNLFSSKQTTTGIESVQANMSHSDSVVAAANAFKALLTTSQINTLQKTFTTSLAQNWSNLPCGSSCRNGIQFSTLSTAQLASAMSVIQSEGGTGANEGYEEFTQINRSDSFLNANGGGSGYGKGIYFLSFLNAPSSSGAWMLQYGGHHYAANIAFNNGTVVGTTPMFEGVEPTSWTSGSNTIAPLTQEHDAMAAMLASLSSTQLASAKLSTKFSDVTLGPGEDGQFPSTKVGLAVSSLSSAQQALIMTAISKWVGDVDDSSAAILTSIYQNELSSTYIAYSGNATLTSNADYVRIDGPSVWIEFICQTGVVFPSKIHYHSVWRDHSRDYGNYLSATSLGGSTTTVTATITAGSATTFCSGGSVVLSANTGTGYTYQWYKDGTAISGASSSTYTATAAGSYTVKVTSGTASATSSAVTVTVNALPTATITASGSVTDVCPGKTVTLTASSASSYSWSTGATTQSITVSAAGSYTVTVTNSGGCSATSAATVVTYQSCGAPSNTTVTSIAAKTATLSWTGTSCAVGYQYQYRVKGTTTYKTGTVAATSKKLTGLQAGTTYEWQVLTGCQKTPTKILSTYVAGPDFTTASSLVADKTVSNINTVMIAAQPALLYPNPASQSVRLSFISAKASAYTVSVYDIHGRTLLTKQGTAVSGSNSVAINIEKLSSGTYFVKLQNGSEASVTKKLVKE